VDRGNGIMGGECSQAASWEDDGVGLQVDVNEMATHRFRGL